MFAHSEHRHSPSSRGPCLSLPRYGGGCPSGQSCTRARRPCPHPCPRPLTLTPSAPQNDRSSTHEKLDFKLHFTCTSYLSHHVLQVRCPPLLPPAPRFPTMRGSQTVISTMLSDLRRGSGRVSGDRLAPQAQHTSPAAQTTGLASSLDQTLDSRPRTRAGLGPLEALHSGVQVAALLCGHMLVLLASRPDLLFTPGPYYIELGFCPAASHIPTAWVSGLKLGGFEDTVQVLTSYRTSADLSPQALRGGAHPRAGAPVATLSLSASHSVPLPSCWSLGT